MSACYRHLIGKVFKRGGGAYPGHWIVISITPRGGCVCLGIGLDGSIVGATNYQPYYVDRKKAVDNIDITQIRFHDDNTETPAPAFGERREETLSLPSLLHTAPSHDGSADRTGEALVP